MFHRKALLGIVSSLLIAQGCNTNRPPRFGTTAVTAQIRIHGTLEGCSGTRIYLDEMGARELIPIDTTECDESGSFEITISADQTAFYQLQLDLQQQATLLLEPGEEVTITGLAGEGPWYSVEGSPGSELIRELSVRHQKTLKALGEISRQNMQAMGDPDYASTKMELDRKFDSVTGEFHDYSLRFIELNSESLAILVALYNLYGQGLPVFHPGDDLEVYQYVDSALYSRFSGYEAVDLLHAQVTEATMDQQKEEHLLGIEKGEFAPDFVSSRPDGSQLALSELRGNYVLISFWAGWSRLSREENRILKQAASSFRAYPFEILQVSLDESKREWSDAIAEDELTWNQVSDLLRWDSPVANLYRVEKIPSNVLVDPEGRVVEKDLLGDGLIEKLEAIFIP
jgi:peroxiredoxin